jgi:glyceraldehyde-3-phosphate dehydrogenase/erythrose-4-phosphate dehydrogenase
LEESVEIYSDYFKPSLNRVVAINDIADKKQWRIIKYDSIHGVLPFTVNHDEKEF